MLLAYRTRRIQGLSYKSLVADEFPGEPEERLLEVVVGLGGDVVVLEVLLAVEGDGLGLDLALLHVDLVSGKDDGNVLADTDQVTWGFVSQVLHGVLVGDVRCQLGTFLYVIREVTSNMMIPHCPLM
jgi:hypothetical protein